jgi:hypothetical protein
MSESKPQDGVPHQLTAYRCVSMARSPLPLQNWIYHILYVVPLPVYVHSMLRTLHLR